jgi:transcriptional regulator with XRE-family HTH domain
MAVGRGRDDVLKSRIGRRAAELREATGLTLADVADRVGINKDTLWRLENGRSLPAVKTLARLADALGADLADLVGKAPAPALDAAVAGLLSEVRGRSTADVLMVRDVARRVFKRLDELQTPPRRSPPGPRP